MGGGAAEDWPREDAAARLSELRPYLSDRLAQLKPYSFGSLADLMQFSSPLGDIPLVREAVQRREVGQQREGVVPHPADVVMEAAHLAAARGVPTQHGTQSAQRSLDKWERLSSAKASVSPGGAVSLAKRSLGLE